MFYTHISDQYSPYFTHPIGATMRDATHVIDGLLHHQTDLQIEEHYTDTAGYTDHVFALCHLLGFRFRPRIRDLADKKLFAVLKPSEYKWLEPLIGGRINERQILNNWSDLLHLAASIKAGTVTASLILASSAPTRDRTVWPTLSANWAVSSEPCSSLITWNKPHLRLQILMGLNKGEARNALARAVFFYRRGEIMDRTWGGAIQ